MIFIQTTENDKSTNDTLDWIYYLNRIVNVWRHNSTQNFISFKLSKGSVVIKNSGQNNLYVDSIKSYWYRRGEYLSNNLKEDKLFNKNVNHFVNDFKFINCSRKIGAYDHNNICKLHSLCIAKNIGLKVPQVIITNDVNDIRDSSSEHFIIKPFFNEKLSFEIDDEYDEIYLYISPQKVRKEEVLNKVLKSDVGAYALFQEYIEKKFELRIFYLNGEFYTMAIFSQQNEKTRIDFRNYDKEKPNRNVPYKLPKDIEEKLGAFMKAIDMNCGSIDMIYTPEGEYVFLEVNPVGQYQWLEFNCNYPVSKRIAETLINE